MTFWHVIIAVHLLFPVIPTPGSREPETIPVPPAPINSADDSTVTVIGDDVTRALKVLQPGAVILSAERYRELMDAAQRIQKPGDAALFLLGACRLTGVCERDALGKEFLKLQVLLEFRTSLANAVVPLGFKGIRLTGATLDGESPHWAHRGDELAVRVPLPGIHKLALETTLPVTRSGQDRRVSIEVVPAAAITTLDVTVPDTVTVAAVKGGGPLTIRSSGANSTLHSPALGVLREFDLSWQLAAPSVPEGPAQLSAQGDVRIHLEPAVIHTEVRLRLEARQGAIPSLQLRLAADATLLEVVVLSNSDETRGTPVEWTAGKPESGLITIKLRQPLTSTESPITLRLRYQQPLPTKPGSPRSLAMLEVQEPKDAVQAGTIALWQAPGVRLHIQNDLLTANPQELPALEQRSATHAFRYWKQPVRFEVLVDPAPLPPLTLDTRVNHTLRLIGQALLLASEFELAPKPGSGVQELEVRWPKGFTLDRRIVLTNLVETIDLTESSVRLRLSGRQQDRFTFRLEGLLSVAGLANANVELPYLLSAAGERNGKKDNAQIVYRPGDLSLAATDADFWLREGTTGLCREGQRPPQLDSVLRETTQFQVETPAAGREPRLVLAWQPRRHEVRSEAQLFVAGDLLQLRQSLHCQWAGAPPAQLWLRFPRVLDKLSRFRLVYDARDGRTVEEDLVLLERPRHSDPKMVERALMLPRDLPERARIELEWRGPLAACQGGSHLLIPLISPSPGETMDRGGEVQIWWGKGIQLSLRQEEAHWRRIPSKVNGDQTLLPGLALQSSSLEAPLALNCEANDSPLPDAVAERVLLEVSPLPGGKLDYHASFALAPVLVPRLELALPGGPRTLALQHVLLAGNELPTASLDFGPHPERTDQMLLRIPFSPDMLAKRTLLVVRFRTQKPSLWPGTRYSFPVPVFPSQVVIGQTRWRIESPVDRLALLTDDVTIAEQSWHWWGWLRPPRPDYLASEMRMWLAGAATPIDAERPALSFAQSGALHSLPVLELPRQVWLLLCSLFVLVAGLLWYCYSPRRLSWWLALAATSLLVLGVWQPHLLVAVLFGIQPGVLVLAVGLSLLWLWRRRWRRQIMTLPGFARRSPGASPTISTNHKRPSLEASSGTSASRVTAEPLA
jgi:hypothetical protein